MTSLRLLVSLTCLAVAACSTERAPEFCRNHALFHAEHAASTAVLSVTMTAHGGIETEIRLPVSTFDQGSTMAVLQDASKVYALQTAEECTAAEVSLSSSNDSIVAAYSSVCGAENKLGQVDVLLFESLPELDEVDVSIVTPATQKHFAINRQCENAIFRFE
ncbi:MAG: hypothetical protein ACR2RD_03125 [Woeseiaceae bacterium]